MPVRNGRIALPPALLAADVAYRRTGTETDRNPTLGCGTILHPREKPGLIHYVFAAGGSIVLLLRGGGWYRDAHGFERRLAPGDLFLRPPGERTSTTPDTGGDAAGVWLEFFLHIPASVWRAATEAGVFADAEPVWHPGIHGDLLRRLLALRERMRDPLAHPTCAVLGEILGLLAELRARHDAGAGTAADPLARAEALLRAHLDQPLPPEAVATRIGMPWETFRKRFRTRTGLAPAAYRQRARLELASSLLADHGLEVGAVARMVGYGDPFAFSKAFRRWTGAPPSSRRHR